MFMHIDRIEWCGRLTKTVDNTAPTTMTMIACHQVKPSAIRELPVKYVEILLFVKTPKAMSADLISRKLEPKVELGPTEVVESPKSPCSPAFLDRFDIIVYPTIGCRTALVWHLKLL